MTYMKKKKNKAIQLDENWLVGEEMVVSEIRPDPGLISRRCVVEEINFLNGKNVIKIKQKLMEQKIVWADGQEHHLPRVIV